MLGWYDHCKVGTTTNDALLFSCPPRVNYQKVSGVL